MNEGSDHNGRAFNLSAAQEVSAFAEDLKSFPAFKRWVPDIVSPGLLRMLQKNTHQQFSAEVPLLKFAAENGPIFFTQHGWKPLEVHSVLKAAARLKRLSFFMRLMTLLPENPNNSGSRPWGGLVC